MVKIDIFVWNGTWEDGKDHTEEINEDQFFMRVCATCGKRRGAHFKKGAGYPAVCNQRDVNKVKRLIGANKAKRLLQIYNKKQGYDTNEI